MKTPHQATPGIPTARRIFFRAGAATLVFCLLTLGLNKSSGAQINTVWNGGTGGWSTGTNWTPNGIPNTNLHNVFIDNGNASASVVTLTSDLTIGGMKIDAGDSLILSPNYYLTVDGGGFAGSGAVVVNGSMTMNPASQFRVGTGTGQTVNLNGTGSLQLNGALIYSIHSGNTLNNNIAISGTGTIGYANLDIVNNGSITSTGAMTLNSPTFTNLGTVTATNGSTINFAGGTYNNAGHVMAADGAGTQLLFGNSVMTVRGGTLRSINGGEVYVQSDNIVLDGETDGALTFEGASRLAGNYYPTFKGSIINNGTMSTASNSQFRVGTGAGQTVTLSSSSYSGELVLDSALVYSTHAGNTFVNGDGHTIRGTGSIGFGVLNLENNGTIGGGAGTLNISPSSTFANKDYGTVNASGGGIVNFQSGNIANAEYAWFRADTSGSINFTGAATLTNYSAGTLLNGRYEVIGGGVLNLGIGNITTLDQSGVFLDGAAATFAPINTIATINSGIFGIYNGRNFTTLSGLTNNNGSIHVGSGSTFTVNGAFNNSGYAGVGQDGSLVATAGPLTQYNPATQTLTGGQFHVAGTLKLDVGDINNLSGSLTLDGPTAIVLKADGSNAIAGLVRVNSGGFFGVHGGATFTGPSSMENNGYVALGNGFSSGSLVVPGTYTQNSGITHLDGGSLIAGSNVFFDGGDVIGEGLIQAGGSIPTITLQGILDPGYVYDVAGAIEFAGKPGMSTGSVYQWSLGNLVENANGTAGTDWDLVTVTDGVIGGNVVEFTLANSWLPESSTPFWQFNHEWDVLIANQNGINASFNLTNANHSAGSFSLGTVSNGNQSILRLYYSASAVPEPSGLALLGLALTGIICHRRRGKFKTGTTWSLIDPRSGRFDRRAINEH